MAAAATIAFHFFISYLLFVSAASRVAVLPFASHEDEGRPTLPSEEMTAEGFRQGDLTLRRPFDAHRPHHHHEDDDALDDHHYHHHHHHPHHHHHHEEDEFLEERRHHRHRRNGEGFVIPYGNDMLIGENSMPRNDEMMEKEAGEVEAVERGAMEELKEWSPSSADWEQAAEERRKHRKANCGHKKKSEEDSDSDFEDDDEAEDRKKELKWMRKKQMMERKGREEDGWMEWFSGFWNGF